MGSMCVCVCVRAMHLYIISMRSCGCLLQCMDLVVRWYVGALIGSLRGGKHNFELNIRPVSRTKQVTG